jgi:hypothetical protein
MTSAAEVLSSHHQSDRDTIRGNAIIEYRLKKKYAELSRMKQLEYIRTTRLSGDALDEVREQD